MRVGIFVLSIGFGLLVGMPSMAEDDVADKALIEAAEKLVSEAARTEAARAGEDSAKDPAKATETKSEEMKPGDVPLVLSEKKAAKVEGGAIWRLVASLAFVAVVAGLVLYATRRWRTRKDAGGQKARIEIVHQFHLGPKRSLALVRVAGEVMLIGITDHNISMLKSVALIDDEMEAMFKGDFNGFLEDEFSVEDVRTALRS
ncbi:MAG: FliO/MopB family protein [Bdellovibrionales bacterium]